MRMARIAFAALLLAAGGARAEYAQGEAAFRARDFSGAYLQLLPAAHAGDPRAMFMLGQMSDAGLGRVQLDPAEAARWFQAASRIGHAPAQYALARAYASGRGVPLDGDLALRWLMVSGAGRFVPALLTLASMADQGVGMERSPERALEWLRQAAEIGSPRAQYQLGERLLRGVGAEANAVEGWEWMRRAAAGGNARALVRLGEAGMTGGDRAARIEALSQVVVAQRRASRDQRAEVNRLYAELTAQMLPDEVAEARQRAQSFRPPPGVDDIEGVAPDAPPAPARGGNRQQGRPQRR